jgi:Outer membrane protein beta-barrel domain
MDYNFACVKCFRCFLLVICIWAAVPAFAAGDVTIFGAGVHQGKLTLQSAQTTASNFSTSFNPGTFGTFGIRVSHGSVIGGEHTIAYAPNFLSADSKAIIYNSDILIQAPLPKVRPYVTAGLGTVFSWGTENGLPALGNIGTKFALNYGGGIKVFPAGPVGVRLDIRGYAIPSATFNLPLLTNPLVTVKSQSQTLNLLEAGIGVVFKF